MIDRWRRIAEPAGRNDLMKGSQTVGRGAKAEGRDRGGVVGHGAKGSNHTEKGEREGANKQQSQWESDKDGTDSRTTGRVECDERETDVPDKAE